MESQKAHKKISSIKHGKATKSSKDSTLRERIHDLKSKDIVIGVVGYAGSGTSYIANNLTMLLNDMDLDEGKYQSEVIKASDIIKEFNAQNENVNASKLQDLGDSIRQKCQEHAAVAALMVKDIHTKKSKQNESEQISIYILDSLKHPAEVELLRQIYGDGFRLIGVDCSPKERKSRLLKKH